MLVLWCLYKTVIPVDLAVIQLFLKDFQPKKCVHSSENGKYISLLFVSFFIFILAAIFLPLRLHLFRAYFLRATLTVEWRGSRLVGNGSLVLCKLVTGCARGLYTHSIFYQVFFNPTEHIFPISRTFLSTESVDTASQKYYVFYTSFVKHRRLVDLIILYTSLIWVRRSEKINN